MNIPPHPLHPLPATGAWKDGDDPGERLFADVGPLELEFGGHLPRVRLAYETWGRLNTDGSNAILLCHALTGDSHATSRDGSEGWWRDVVGPGKALDTDRYFIVCPNVLSGCQGSTGPASPADDGRPWGSRFPEVTIRDSVIAEERLMRELGITRWLFVLGASFGGNRALEWAATFPKKVGAVGALVCAAATTAEQIAWQHAQNSAITLDPKFRGGDYYDADDGDGPHAGLGLAREIAHTTYRSPLELAVRFGRTAQAGEDPRAGGRYAVASYLDHHGTKLAARFDANSYLSISQAMISHDIGRGRGGTESVLTGLTQPALVVNVDSDRLFYPSDVAALADQLPGCAGVITVHSDDGHDGFLIEAKQVSEILTDFLDSLGS